MFEYGFIVSADALGQMIFSPIFGLMADKLNSIRLVSLICCITFSLGNLFYANISVVPKTLGSIPLARMYALILARFIVGNVMITLLLILGSSKEEKMFPSHCQYTDDLLVVFTCDHITSSHFLHYLCHNPVEHYYYVVDKNIKGNFFIFWKCIARRKRMRWCIICFFFQKGPII